MYLFEHKQLANILSSNTPNQLYTKRGAAIDKNSAAPFFTDSIYNLVWGKLEKELDGINTVYYAADGLLHQVPFAALGQKETTTMGMRFNLVQLSSTANVVDIRPRKEGEDIVLVVGVDYAYDTTSKNKTDQVKYSYLSSETLSRSSAANSTGLSWNYLPGTKTEVETINILAGKSGVSTIVMSDNLATEEQVKGLGGKSPSVLP